MQTQFVRLPFSRFLVAGCLLAFLMISALGCGKSGPATHRVKGKIVLTKGDLSALSTSSLEVAQEENDDIRSFSAIGSDGSFDLQTYYLGEIYNGVIEGTYRARIVLPDDDPANRRQAAKVVPKRYLEFASADLTFKVPSDAEVILQIGGK